MRRTFLQAVCGLVVGMAVFFLFPDPRRRADLLRAAVAVLASAAVGVLLAPPSRPTTVERKVLAVFGGAAAGLALLLVGYFLNGLGYFTVMTGISTRLAERWLAEQSGRSAGELTPGITFIFMVLAPIVLQAITCTVTAPVSALLAIRGRPAIPSRIITS